MTVEWVFVGMFAGVLLVVLGLAIMEARADRRRSRGADGGGGGD